ncbi:hypothetical protein MIND_00741800 [Mycena indigotica]|uniref:Uncharacterized protein n=1 Tax=Mycena indigotica TaxID=2126181 RepID=A0A8H6SMY1_9AGAR|nr:uncharacterized protein MIND_00741800 [Mycena indigotica]KAF7301762.1 hypothetical protein MIND_00741800 [Mycena indigotica]
MPGCLQFCAACYRAIVDSFAPSVPPPISFPDYENLGNLSMYELSVMMVHLESLTWHWERLSRQKNLTQEQRDDAAFIYPQFKEQLAKVQAAIELKKNPPKNSKNLKYD